MFFFQQDIIAISCSWCKAGVSGCLLVIEHRQFLTFFVLEEKSMKCQINCLVNLFQYHNKVECFKMHKIDEMCDLGAHANLIVPPSWVVKLPPRRVSWRTFFALFCLDFFFTYYS